VCGNLDDLDKQGRRKSSIAVFAEQFQVYSIYCGTCKKTFIHIREVKSNREVVRGRDHNPESGPYSMDSGAIDPNCPKGCG